MFFALALALQKSVNAFVKVLELIDQFLEPFLGLVHRVFGGDESNIIRPEI